MKILIKSHLTNKLLKLVPKTWISLIEDRGGLLEMPQNLALNMLHPSKKVSSHRICLRPNLNKITVRNQDQLLPQVFSKLLLRCTRKRSWKSWTNSVRLNLRKWVRCSRYQTMGKKTQSMLKTCRVLLIGWKMRGSSMSRTSSRTLTMTTPPPKKTQSLLFQELEVQLQASLSSPVCRSNLTVRKLQERSYKMNWPICKCNRRR